MNLQVLTKTTESFLRKIVIISHIIFINLIEASIIKKNYCITKSKELLINIIDNMQKEKRLREEFSGKAFSYWLLAFGTWLLTNSQQPIATQ